MRTATLRSFALACFASAALLTTGCNRNNDVTPSDDITTAEDRTDDNSETAMSSEAMQMAGPTDPQTQGSPNLIGDADFRARFGSCASRSYDFATKTLTIDFGTTNCLCADGRYRRGKILVRFTTDVNRRTAGAVVTRENYFVNDNQHTATRTFTDTGLGSFTVDVTNASIIRANGGGTHSWTANWTFTRTAGYGTPQVSDDVYSVTGSATGTNRKNVGYTATIQSPLIKRADCPKYFVQGTIGVTNTNSKTMTLDYGTGTCDNVATVTVNGHTRTIQLR
ncbi:hypothetical protein MON38_14395 [Hymenobacter sp. DH14]|uniref:Lipoprotein n=1 Tax=Hymenobacter cyanobacteriorum TaxID=2926463 RepID=A0A9X2AFW7_9BACT|nr:hypothetical protein [Hymenobacter cyanobacteriorum]MCI1188616.1 hypothetical protein [Hymenobacter cyanobacteriorum]